MNRVKGALCPFLVILMRFHFLEAKFSTMQWTGISPTSELAVIDSVVFELAIKDWDKIVWGNVFDQTKTTGQDIAGLGYDYTHKLTGKYNGLVFIEVYSRYNFLRTGGDSELITDTEQCMLQMLIFQVSASRLQSEVGNQMPHFYVTIPPYGDGIQFHREDLN